MKTEIKTEPESVAAVKDILHETVHLRCLCDELKSDLVKTKAAYKVANYHFCF